LVGRCSWVQLGEPRVSVYRLGMLNKGSTCMALKRAFELKGNLHEPGSLSLYLIKYDKWGRFFCAPCLPELHHISLLISFTADGSHRGRSSSPFSHESSSLPVRVCVTENDQKWKMAQSVTKICKLYIVGKLSVRRTF
jgi:hypothetical protein